MRAHTQVHLVEVRGSVSFVSVCCVCSQGQPQPARARPSQPPARQGRSHQARPSQAQERNEKWPSGRVTEPHELVASLGDLGVF